MKLLILTQAVDEQDPVLGFFCRWIKVLAARVPKITVICLTKGSYTLPDNVRVYSLGKERGARSKFAYLWRFFTLAYQLRDEYDTVLVHMNQEYVLLGAPLWKAFGKRIFLWRNHAKGSVLTRLASALSLKVFYTSPRSFTAALTNAVRMPVGIDTEFFSPDPSARRIPHSILFLGRVAPVKNVHAFIELLARMKERGTAFKVTIAGSALRRDALYEQQVHAAVSKYGLRDQVRFVGEVDAEGARHLYRTHELYVNLTPPGSMDKTIFEALACSAEVLVHNDDLSGELGDKRVVYDLGGAGAATKLIALLNSPQGTMREYVERHHSLPYLADRLVEEMAEPR